MSERLTVSQGDATARLGLEKMGTRISEGVTSVAIGRRCLGAAYVRRWKGRKGVVPVFNRTSQTPLDDARSR